MDRAVGRVDVLVNNAAVHYDTGQNAVDVDLAVVREAIETNVLGAWQTTLAFLPLLRRSAHPRVVMVSSEGGSLASMGGGTPAYSVSKAALNALTRVLAGDLRRDGVLVNAVCPGWTATDMGGRGRAARRRGRAQRAVGRRPARRRPDRHLHPRRASAALVAGPAADARCPGRPAARVLRHRSPRVVAACAVARAAAPFGARRRPVL